MFDKHHHECSISIRIAVPISTHPFIPIEAVGSLTDFLEVTTASSCKVGNTQWIAQLGRFNLWELILLAYRSDESTPFM